MTAEEFRELALSFADATEGQHMRHPDFRAHGRIFATLAYPNAEWGMVKLTPADQKRFVELHPQAFMPVKGAWGLQGSTSVRLAAAKSDIVTQVLDLAWQNAATKPTTAKRASRTISLKRVT
jgi:YjbR protein